MANLLANAIRPRLEVMSTGNGYTVIAEEEKPVMRNSWHTDLVG